MIHPYQLHPLSKNYYEEALQEPRVRQLGHRAKTHRRSRSEEQVRSPWLSHLAAAVRLS